MVALIRGCRSKSCSNLAWKILDRYEEELILKITRNNPQIELKSIEKLNENPFKTLPKSLRNPYQTPPKKANVCQIDFYCDFFNFLQICGRLLAAIWPPKCDKNQSRIEFEKTSVFQIEFYAILSGLDCQNAPPKRTCFSFFLKTRILQKSCSRAGRNAIFRVRSLPKSIKKSIERC